MDEIWKPISDYIEEISNYGRIRRGTDIKEPSKKPEGYSYITLSRKGKHKNFYIHRLVAQAFLPNPLNLPQVNHKIEGDEGKTMNMVIFNEDGTIDEDRTTIEWVTPKENSNYATRNERISKTMTNGKTSKPVLQLSLSGDFIREWPSVAECGRNGFDISNVCKCCNGERKTHKGFRFMFADDYKEKILVEELQKENEELKSKYEELKSRYEQLKTDFILELTA